MADTYDLATDIGKVRLLIPDSDLNNVVFHDTDIQALVDLEGDVRRAAATALEVIASNEAMVLKVIATLDLKTDGAKTSDALLARATRLRAQADVADDLADDDDSFAIAEFADPVFGIRDRIYKQASIEAL